MKSVCHSCLHLMTPEQSADGVRRCRVNRDGLPVSPELEADCQRYVREPGSDDNTPIWYARAWRVGGEGSGD